MLVYMTLYRVYVVQHAFGDIGACILQQMCGHDGYSEHVYLCLHVGIGCLLIHIIYIQQQMVIIMQLDVDKSCDVHPGEDSLELYYQISCKTLPWPYSQ